MQLEQHNENPHPAPPPLPPCPAADNQAVYHVGQPSAPSPVVTQPNRASFNTNSFFQRHSQEVVCSSCGQQVVTKREYRIGGSTWFMCCVVFLVGGFFGCCFFPFFMKSCKDVVHRCPECNTVLGRKPLI